MTTSPDWRCLGCGSHAETLPGTVDPRYPLGRCSRPPKGCGVVPITRDLDRLERALTANGWERKRNRHKWHMGSGGLTMRCELCRDLLAAGAARRREHATT